MSNKQPLHKFSSYFSLGAFYPSPPTSTEQRNWSTIHRRAQFFIIIIVSRFYVARLNLQEVVVMKISLEAIRFHGRRRPLLFPLLHKACFCTKTCSQHFNASVNAQFLPLRGFFPPFRTFLCTLTFFLFKHSNHVSTSAGVAAAALYTQHKTTPKSHRQRARSFQD